ncbi:MAG: hypothetical protein ACAI44_31400 [Candidatus Sericytochromatia bacterium]
MDVDEIPARHCCLQSGSLVDTPAGRQPVDCLRPGDHVWGFDRGERVSTLIEKIYRDERAPEGLMGRRLHDTVTVAGSVYLFWKDQWVRAEETDLPEVGLIGPIYDLSTDAGNYFCKGVLIGHLDPEEHA